MLEQKIYNRLSDEISKNIFWARVNYMRTGNMSHINNIPLEYRNISSDIILFEKKLKNHDGYRLAVFGAGANGYGLVNSLKYIQFDCFIDNYSQNKVEPRTGIPIYKLNEYKEMGLLTETKYVISVSNKNAINAIKEQLIQEGVKEDNIIHIGDWRNNHSQYFDVFGARENEVFMDCGCFDGSTAFRFAAWCAQGGYSYKKIICFEPDDQSFEKCNQILSTIKNCELFKCGLSDKKGKVAFYSNGHEDARIVSDSDTRNMGEIEVINLDSFIDEDISFIKMDIEGAELDALKGATNIIRTKKPRLAISIYHKSDDIIKIPEFLLELNPDYSFKLRHYSLLGNETVLYAE